jgi:hypothetical protein
MPRLLLALRPPQKLSAAAHAVGLGERLFKVGCWVKAFSCWRGGAQRAPAKSFQLPLTLLVWVKAFSCWRGGAQRAPAKSFQLRRQARSQKPTRSCADRLPLRFAALTS